MKLGKLFATLALAAPLVVATPAFADDAWKASTSFTYSGQAAIKIVEPKGMKVLFTGSDGKPAEDTLPAVISVANQDAFVPVTFVAEDGSKHTEKFEVKRGQTTEVHVVHTAKGAAAAAPTAAPARKVIGHLVNASAACPNSNGWNARLDFVGKVDGNTAASIRSPRITSASPGAATRQIRSRFSSPSRRQVHGTRKGRRLAPRPFLHSMVQRILIGIGTG